MPNTQASSVGMFAVTKPHAATSAIAISRVFTSRINEAMSRESASCPAVAENNRNGAMNTAPITSPACAGGSQLTCSW